MHILGFLHILGMDEAKLLTSVWTYLTFNEALEEDVEEGTSMEKMGFLEIFFFQ